MCAADAGCPELGALIPGRTLVRQYVRADEATGPRRYRATGTQTIAAGPPRSRQPERRPGHAAGTSARRARGLYTGDLLPNQHTHPIYSTPGRD